MHEVLWNSHTMKMLQARPERSNQQLLFQRSRYHRIDPPTIQHEIDPWLSSQHEYNNCWNSRSEILFPVIDATERKIGPITLMSHGSVNLPKPDFARHSSKRDPHSEWFYFTTQLSDAGFIAPGISATPGQHNAGAMKSSQTIEKVFHPSLGTDLTLSNCIMQKEVGQVLEFVKYGISGVGKFTLPVTTPVPSLPDIVVPLKARDIDLQHVICLSHCIVCVCPGQIKNEQGKVAKLSVCSCIERETSFSGDLTLCQGTTGTRTLGERSPCQTGHQHLSPWLQIKKLTTSCCCMLAVVVTYCVHTQDCSNVLTTNFTDPSSVRSLHPWWPDFFTLLCDAGFRAPGISATPGQHNAEFKQSSKSLATILNPSPEAALSSYVRKVELHLSSFWERSWSFGGHLHSPFAKFRTSNLPVFVATQMDFLPDTLQEVTNHGSAYALPSAITLNNKEKTNKNDFAVTQNRKKPFAFSSNSVHVAEEIHNPNLTENKKNLCLCKCIQLINAGFIAPGISATPGQHNADFFQKHANLQAKEQPFTFNEKTFSRFIATCTLSTVSRVDKIHNFIGLVQIGSLHHNGRKLFVACVLCTGHVATQSCNSVVMKNKKNVCTCMSCTQGGMDEDDKLICSMKVHCYASPDQNCGCKTQACMHVLCGSMYVSFITMCMPSLGPFHVTHDACSVRFATTSFTFGFQKQWRHLTDFHAHFNCKTWTSCAFFHASFVVGPTACVSTNFEEVLVYRSQGPKFLCNHNFHCLCWTSHSSFLTCVWEDPAACFHTDTDFQRFGHRCCNGTRTCRYFPYWLYPRWCVNCFLNRSSWQYHIKKWPGDDDYTRSNLANRGNQTEVKISFDELLTEHPYNFNLHCRFDTCATCLLPVRSVSCFTAKTNQTISDNDITLVMPSSMQSNVLQNYKIYEQLTQVQRTACGGTLGCQQCNYINMSMVGRDGAHICDPIVLIFELAWLGHLDWLKFGIALLTWLIPHLPKWKNAKLDQTISQRSLIPARWIAGRRWKARSRNHNREVNRLPRLLRQWVFFNIAVILCIIIVLWICPSRIGKAQNPGPEGLALITCNPTTIWNKEKTSSKCAQP